MYFMILDDAANAVDAFTDERDAVAALVRLVAAQPDAADQLLLLRYDEDGNPVGEALEARIVAPALSSSADSHVVLVAWQGLRMAVSSVPPTESRSFYGSGFAPTSAATA